MVVDEARWQKYYELCQNYYECYHNTDVRRDFKTKDGINYDEEGLPLGTWVSNQRMLYKKGKLLEHRKELLEKLNIIWYKEDPWYYKYNLFITYVNNQKEFPSNTFKTLDGLSYNEDGVNIYLWFLGQRKNYLNHKMPVDKRKLLAKYILLYDSNFMKWQEYYELTVIYYKNHGNIDMPLRYVTNNIPLGRWLQNQKIRYKSNKLAPERVELLENLGIKWYLRENNWQDKFNLVKAYYEHHGHINIPDNFRTINGYEYDPMGIDLSNWLVIQKNSYHEHKMSNERIKLLESIGIVWENLNDYRFNFKLNLVIKYINHYQSIKIKPGFRTLDGINYDVNGIRI